MAFPLTHKEMVMLIRFLYEKDYSLEDIAGYIGLSTHFIKMRMYDMYTLPASEYEAFVERMNAEGWQSKADAMAQQPDL